ncbi:MAG TPA: response regulator [Tepidisphaeraceae bacterium]
MTLTSEGSTPAEAPAPSTILVVDDNTNVTQALVLLIQRAGYNAVGCHNGTDALACVETTKPSAAVVDVHLPDMNGLILAQKLRVVLGKDVPIIVVSGDTSMETLNSLSHVGATYFFSKPLSSQSLLKHLKTLLSGGTPDGAQSASL